VSTTQPAGLVCTGCDRTMRRRGVKLAEAPDTIAYAHSGKCSSCLYPAVPKIDPDEPIVQKHDDPNRMLATVTALEHWMRSNRGVARESRNPIKYQRAAA
jgi:hypothetical protein